MTPSPIAAQIKLKEPGQVKLTVPGLTGELWPYQVNDVAWMLAQRQGVIGHGVGTGKTVFAIAVASWLKARGELRGMVVLCPKQAGILVDQWRDELGRWAPDLQVAVVADLPKPARAQMYREQWWDVLLVNYEAARNDTPLIKEMAERRQPSVLYADEASAFRTPTSKVAHLIKAIAPYFPYRFAATGTPIETGVEDLHSIMWNMGWEEVVGSRAWFLRQYAERETVEVYIKGGRKIRKTVITGYKNLGDLRERIEPWHIRRTEKDPEVASHLPTVQSFVHHVPMTRRQAAGYQALKDGIRAEMRDGQIKITKTGVQGPWVKMLGAADGLRTIDPDMADESGKSDWLMDSLEAQFAGEKVLVFSRFVRSIWPLEERLRAAGIGYGRFLGSSWQSDDERRADVARFRGDPNCRVLLATSAVERGLNLQVARVAVFYGIIPNPARLEQIMGRIRRGGSPHASVYGVTLLSADTVEEPLYEKVLERNAVKDFVWEEESVLFEKLGPRELAAMIAA